MKCIVMDCENDSQNGKFIGDLCSPCHSYITTGKGKYSQAYRNNQKEQKELFAQIKSIFAGIDKEETDSPDGWWETSAGAEFGKNKLLQIKELLEKQG